MHNKAIIKIYINIKSIPTHSQVNDAERERYESEREHQKTDAMFAEAEQKVKNLQKDLRRQIAKSRYRACVLMNNTVLLPRAR